MGPNDPYAKKRANHQPPDVEGSQPNRWGGRIALALGALIGIGLGVVNVVGGFTESLTVLVWVVIGMAIAWFVHALARGTFDLGGALRALLRKE